MAQGTSSRLTAAALGLLIGTALGATAADTPSTGAAAGKPLYGAWGVDLTAEDPKVRPGDDFFEFANGAWLARTRIPDDEASVGAGKEVFDRTQDQLRSLIEDSAKGATSPTARQIGGLFAAFMDEAHLETLDAAPLRADLATIHALRSKAQLARWMGHTQASFGAGFVNAGPSPDAKNPELNLLYVGQDGLGLPDRDYYLSDQLKDKREAYGLYVARTLALVQYPAADTAARSVLDLETQIAEVSWPSAERRELDKIYNPMTLSELNAFAPGFAWQAYFEAMGAPSALGTVVLMEKSAIARIAALFAATPLETLKAWATFHWVDNASPYLSKRFDDNRFGFRSTVMRGVQTQRPRWKRGVALVDSSLGEVVGREYVARYFPPESKVQMDRLIVNLKAAMAARIQAAPWMAPETKSEAAEKLARMQVFVGYPSRWRDYSGLVIDATDLYHDVIRAGAFENAYQLAKVGKKVDHEQWDMTPQTVDAYNGGLENKIVFPAGILQAPLFDPNADAAVNYGAIGAIIGHEITHGFDDQGRKIDASGALRDWWTPTDAARFEVEADKLGRQYDGYEPVPGMHINGKLTMGENIADLGGLVLALDAYHESLGGQPAPVIDGLTGDQRLFRAFAQSWRGKAREDAIRQQLTSDPHSPRQYRVDGPTRNIDPWYAAFGVTAGDRLYLAPDSRAHIW